MGAIASESAPNCGLTRGCIINTSVTRTATCQQVTCLSAGKWFVLSSYVSKAEVPCPLKICTAWPVFVGTYGCRAGSWVGKEGEKMQLQVTGDDVGLGIKPNKGRKEAVGQRGWGLGLRACSVGTGACVLGGGAAPHALKRLGQSYQFVWQEDYTAQPPASGVFFF